MRSDWMESEERRRSALLAGDAIALAELIDPRCIFVHGSGWVESGADYVHRMAASESPYLTLQASDENLTEFGDVAVITYRQSARMRIDGVEQDSHSVCTAAWHRPFNQPDQVGPRLISFHNAVLTQIIVNQEASR